LFARPHAPTMGTTEARFPSVPCGADPVQHEGVHRPARAVQRTGALRPDAATPRANRGRCAVVL